MTRIAIAQVAMHWTTEDNLAEMLRAMDLAHDAGAALCAFSELAVTGFHREIRREATPERVTPAIQALQRQCARLSLGIAVGAPSFGVSAQKYNAHFLIDEQGRTRAVVEKRGLTQAEATFFSAGTARPVAILQGRRCSAVICREVADIDIVTADLPPGRAELIFVPGALRRDPEKPWCDPPEYVRDIQRLALATGAHVVQTNWPNALNRPEEGVEGGGSTVAAPNGEVLFRLPAQAAGVGVFDLGERQVDWHPC